MKLPFRPEIVGYSVAEGQHRTISEQLDSPAPDVGKGIARTAFEVSCQFILDEEEYKQFCLFYEEHMFGKLFEADLILDDPNIIERKCKFSYDSFSLKQKGEAYFITITIMAK